MNNNKLVAEFMGYDISTIASSGVEVVEFESKDTKVENLKYHTSWDWLMPVVHKIEGLGYWVNRNDGDVTITDESDIIVITPMSSGGIDMMYKAVVEFINQYNNEG